MEQGISSWQVGKVLRKLGRRPVCRLLVSRSQKRCLRGLRHPALAMSHTYQALIAQNGFALALLAMSMWAHSTLFLGSRSDTYNTLESYQAGQVECEPYICTEVLQDLLSRGEDSRWAGDVRNCEHYQEQALRKNSSLFCRRLSDIATCYEVQILQTLPGWRTKGLSPWVLQRARSFWRTVRKVILGGEGCWYHEGSRHQIYDSSAVVTEATGRLWQRSQRFTEGTLSIVTLST